MAKLLRNLLPVRLRDALDRIVRGALAGERLIEIYPMSVQNYKEVQKTYYYDYPELSRFRIDAVLRYHDVEHVRCICTDACTADDVVDDFVGYFDFRTIESLSLLYFEYADDSDLRNLVEGGRGNCFAVARIIKLILDRSRVSNLIVETCDASHCYNQVCWEWHFVFIDYFRYRKSGYLVSGYPFDDLSVCYDWEAVYDDCDSLGVCYDVYLTNREVAQALGGVTTQQEVLELKLLQHVDERMLRAMLQAIQREGGYRFSFDYRVICLQPPALRLLIQKKYH